MARYLVNLRDLELALRGLGVPVHSTAVDDADRTVEMDLEPVDPPSYAADSSAVRRKAEPYALARSEPLRAPLEELVGRGLSNRQIAMELNDRCLFGPQGGLWHSSSIKRLRRRLGV